MNAGASGVAGLVRARSARGRSVRYDPGFRNGWQGNLWPSEFAAAHGVKVPAGYTL